MRITSRLGEQRGSSRSSAWRAAAHRIAFLSTLVFTVSSAHAAIPASERDVLTNLYQSTQGSEWIVSTNWNGAPGTECSWYGITCDGAQTHVVGVALTSNALNGPLPALGALTELQVFDIHNDPQDFDIAPDSVNHVSGSIPALAGLTHLVAFRASSNQLSGPIPQLAGLTNLQVFDVHANGLTGSLPALAGLTRLQQLDVSFTSISGPIPPLSTLTQLQNFIAEYTQLTGSIPDLSGLGNLQTFDVSESTLDGGIGSLNGLVSLVKFDASWCQLKGPIPAIHDSVNLAVLDVSHNRLSGPIPAFPSSTSLWYIDLSFNQLSSIPSLSGLVNLEFLRLNDNALTGTIPSLSGLASLLIIDLHDNALSGPIPALSGQGLLQLQTFDATGNQLTGPIPSLAGLSTLIEFLVGDNRLTGHVPSLAGQGLNNLQGFAADHNELSGSIPAFSGTPFLSYFNVSGNALTGSIPSFSQVPRMADFRASSNLLTGSIPALSSLTILKRFDVGFNELTGSIPATAPSAPLSTAASSTLCPNRLTHSPSTSWDDAVGYSPWYRSCAEQYVNLDQIGLTGSWYNVDDSGKGIVFDVMPDRVGPGAGVMFGGWFNYLCSHDLGCPVNATEPVQLQQWFSVQGEVDASQPYASLGIYESRGGNFDAPPAIGATPVGVVSIAFEDCTHGVANYHFANGRYPDKAIPLSRLLANTSCTPEGNVVPAPSNALLSGAWYDAEKSGQGLVFDISAAQDAFFAGWYTYAVDGSLGDPREGQRWYTLQSAFAPGATSFDDVPIYQTTGSDFDAPTDVHTVPVGKANVSFESCTAMTVSYTFTAGENAGRSATMHLVRLSSAPPGCGI